MPSSTHTAICLAISTATANSWLQELGRASGMNERRNDGLSTSQKSETASLAALVLIFDSTTRAMLHALDYAKLRRPKPWCARLLAHGVSSFEASTPCRRMRQKSRTIDALVRGSAFSPVPGSRRDASVIHPDCSGQYEASSDGVRPAEAAAGEEIPRNGVGPDQVSLSLPCLDKLIASRGTSPWHAVSPYSLHLASSVLGILM